MNGEILDKVRQIAALREKAEETHRKLERALVIQALWPDAFSHGAVTSAWISPSGVTDMDRRWAARGFEKKTGINADNFNRVYRVTDGAGETREWKFMEVPVELGGGKA